MDDFTRGLIVGILFCMTINLIRWAIKEWSLNSELDYIVARARAEGEL